MRELLCGAFHFTSELSMHCSCRFVKSFLLLTSKGQAIELFDKNAYFRGNGMCPSLRVRHTVAPMRLERLRVLRKDS